MSAGIAEIASPPFVAQMEAANRRRSTRFRLIFVLTWAVILGAVVALLIVNPERDAAKLAAA